MKDKRWKQFDKLMQKCYANMVGAVKDGSCWEQAFELLMEIVQENRVENPNFASDMETLEDTTDYEYDIQGWLEDCLDEIDMRENYALLLKMCNELLSMFSWLEYTGNDIKFRKASVLASLGQKKEAAEFCEEWLRTEPENIMAATASVYALIGVKAFEKAEKLVDQFIFDKTKCTEENDFMFTAAAKLYQVMGKKKEKKMVDKALEEYEEYLKEYFELPEFDEEDEFWDDELPFT